MMFLNWSIMANFLIFYILIPLLVYFVIIKLSYADDSGFDLIF